MRFLTYGEARLSMHHLKCALAALLALALGTPASFAAPGSRDGIRIGASDIGGVVRSDHGVEPGVWVIAERTDLPTRFAKIVVTDDLGRYLVPDLPAGRYELWVRGYGLADAPGVDAQPGRQVDLPARIAPTAAVAARVYPPAYWYALMRLPSAAEVARIPGGLDAYLTFMKSDGCVGCHQMGDLATRTIPAALGRYSSAEAAWMRRIQSGQAGDAMVRIATGRLQGVPIKYLADWTDRIAAGELPASTPPRPSGLERNAVVTVHDWATPTAYLHDLSSTYRNDPTTNAHGLIYGTPELSTDDFPIFDPRTRTATSFQASVRDADTPSTADDPVIAPSVYWGSQRIWHSRAIAHNPMLDPEGRVWYTARIRAANNPAFCKAGSKHPSARLFPLDSSGRQIAVYDPRTKHYGFVDTCYSTHHLQFATDGHTLWTSGGQQVIGWLDTAVFERTGDAAKAQRWAPFVLDTDGNGKLDRWTEPGQPARRRMDQRLGVSIYAVMPNPADGSVWGSVMGYPGGIVRFDPRTMLSEYYQPPLPGFGVRGADIDTHGVVWVSLASGHLGRFDRRSCKKRSLKGPKATGAQCPEGWRFYRLPGPGFVDLPQPSVESSYYTWVDQHDTLGLGDDVPIVTGNLAGGVHALVNGKFVTLRVPYPLGFYMKGVDGRIDDPRGGWKGRGLWITSGDRTPFHHEGGKINKPLIVHIQVRPDPLAD
jgi:hypothetical protein